MKVGTRVIRGPDWSGGIVDGGEGHVGTIQGQQDEDTAIVIWDNGERVPYQLGLNKLLILDTGPTGIRHKGYTCAGCGDEDIGGCRWTCSQCTASSLCTRCYGDMKHDITHTFLRFDTSTSKRVEVPPRCSSVRIQSLGLYPNAVVKMKSERKGKILTVGDHRYGASVRSMVRIQWEDGETGIYRAGHEGEVDVRYVTEYPGMFYYRDHLQRGDFCSTSEPNVPINGRCSSTKPKVFTQGDSSSTKPKAFTQSEPSSTKPKAFTQSDPSSTKPKAFTQGDRVCIRVSASELRDMQKKDGIWNDKLDQYVNKFGKVKNYTSTGHVAVAFSGDVMVLCEKALKKIPLLTEGDTVRISPNLDELVQLQTGHGGFIGEKRMAINKVGVVKKVEDQGTVLIGFGSILWHFNPACCIPAPGAQVDDIAVSLPTPTKAFFEAMMRQGGSSEDEDRDDVIPTTLDGEMVNDCDLIQRTEAMFETFKRGDNKRSLEIMRSDTRLATMNNQLPFVRQLMDEGVNINQQTQGGNIALTCAVMRGNLEMVKLFLERGCNVNSGGRADSPIEVAVKMGFTDIVKMLIERDVDVNRLDRMGETACHVCTLSGKYEILSLILAKTKFDPLLLNERGFTILQTAAITGNHRAVEIILEKFPNTVDCKMMQFKFTALHIAANNDRTDCIRVLVDKGKCDINMTNSEGWTALHLASVNLFNSSIECLLKKGADVNVKDKQGQTALHYVMGGAALSGNTEVLGFKAHESVSDEQRIHLSCKLLQHGANPDIKNCLGRTPLECAVNSTVRSAVTMFIRSRSGKGTSSSETSTTESVFNLPCANCIDARVDTKIQPCGHKFLCRVCISKVKLCPFCKVDIEGNEDLPNTASQNTDENCKLQ